MSKNSASSPRSFWTIAWRIPTSERTVSPIRVIFTIVIRPKASGKSGRVVTRLPPRWIVWVPM